MFTQLIEKIEKDNLYVSSVLSLRSYILEFKTLNLSVPRGLGKTHFICDTAKPWDLIITTNMAMKEIVIEKTRNVNVITTYHFLNKYILQTHLYNRIWFDEVDFMKPEYLDILFKYYIKDYRQSIVGLRTGV